MQKKLPQKLAMHSSLQFDDEHWQIANHEKWKTKKLSSWVVPLWGVIFVPWTLLDSFGESIMIRAPAKPFKTHINNNANAPQSTTRHIRLLKRHEATYSTRGHLFSEHSSSWRICLLCFPFNFHFCFGFVFLSHTIPETLSTSTSIEQGIASNSENTLRTQATK